MKRCTKSMRRQRRCDISAACFFLLLATESWSAEQSKGKQLRSKVANATDGACSRLGEHWSTSQFANRGAEGACPVYCTVNSNSALFVCLLGPVFA